MSHRLSHLHPFCFAAAPIVLLAAANADQVALASLAPPLCAATAGAGIIYALLWRLRRDAARAAAVTSLWVVVFFSYGHIFEAISECVLYSLQPRRLHVPLASAMSAIALAGSWILWKTSRRRALAHLTRWLATTSFLLLAIGLTGLAGEFKWRRAALSRSASVESVKQKNSSGLHLPDVYYIILDGYARDDVLREVYRHDNSAFTGYLRSRGFFVADHSASNYAMTFLSLASTLNMRYLNDEADRIGRHRRRRKPIHRLLWNNETTRRLRARGYRYVHFNTSWSGTQHSPLADVSLSPHPLWLQQEFMGVLLRTTLLAPLVPSVAESHLFALNKLKEIPHMAGPTFTFAHLLLPHNPYVFDRDGNVRYDVPAGLHFDTSTGGWRNRQGYIDQLIFLNRMMRETIDAILESSPTPPIIIVQADHGTASRKRGGVRPREQPDLIRERMPILNAYFVPPAFRERLYPGVSPVNTFRLLFATVFNEPIQRLEDRHYFSWYKRPYRLTDVTELLDKADGM